MLYGTGTLTDDVIVGDVSRTDLCRQKCVRSAGDVTAVDRRCYYGFQRLARPHLTFLFFRSESNKQKPPHKLLGLKITPAVNIDIVHMQHNLNLKLNLNLKFGDIIRGHCWWRPHGTYVLTHAHPSTCWQVLAHAHPSTLSVRL